jgi:hypothetical protein
MYTKAFEGKATSNFISFTFTYFQEDMPLLSTYSFNNHSQIHNNFCFPS